MACNLFKGFVPTRNKQCIVKFKNRELSTFEQVSSLDEYAGILADDVILIDIDDKEQSEIMMSIVEEKQLLCRVYETTKGMHFLFKNSTGLIDRCKTKTAVACGLVVDIKVGANNSYSVLKFDGKERKIIYDIFDDEDYEEVPKWMLPVTTKTNFQELKAGDGRNQALFNYILTLQSYDFSQDEARECLKIINDYILPDPLPEGELETIMRDDAFQKETFFKKGQFLFDKFARYLINSHHIVKINKQLHIYKDGIYIDSEAEIEAEMIKHISDLNRSKRAEVLSYISLLAKDVKMSPANYVAFKNGIYDLDTDELLPFSTKIVITNKINFDYRPGAYSEITDKTLNKLACSDPEIRALLEEAIGYCFYRRNELRKCFILTGDKQNGKSTFLSMIEHLLGQDNITSLDLKELGERFKTAELFGKLANIGDDIGDEFIPNPAIFKKLVSGNPINIERKGKDPFDFSNYSKLLFSANNIPRIKDKSGAVISRLVIIPFDARFTVHDADFDPYIKYKLIQDVPMEYLIQIGLEGLKRVLKNQQFTESAKVGRSIEEYEENNNPVLLFFKEEPKIENETTNAVYSQYRIFCSENNFTPMSKIEFSKKIRQQFDFSVKVKKLDGKTYRIYVKEGES